MTCLVGCLFSVVRVSNVVTTLLGTFTQGFQDDQMLCRRIKLADMLRT